jgi:HD-like signal output (HDOD) protein/CheY-like chemotaxis protein
VKQILFVDDDPTILAGLEGELRRVRHKWEMTFVTSGDKALSTASSTPFDVIITDLRMPGMDGPALLRQIRSIYPKMIRMLLAPAADLEPAMRSLSVAHQVLGKPCDGATVEAVVDRACELQIALANDAVRSAIGGVDRLPSPPRTYLAVTTALENPDSSLNNIANIIERDMAASAKVLQVVNSAFFALRHDVKNIKQALSYLGVNMMRRILLSVETFSMYENHKGELAVSIDAIQEHGVAVGSLATALMGNAPASEDAFMAGMLHDVGQLILATHSPERYAKVRSMIAKDGVPIHVAEREVLGATHAQVGAYLLALWGLPDSIVETAAHHHAPASVRHSSFEVLDAVYVADALVQELVGDEGTCGPGDLIDIAHLDSLGVAGSLPAWRHAAARALSDALRK